MGPFPCSFQRSKPRQIFTMSVFESYWANKAACDDAERAYYEKLSGCKVDGLVSASGSSEDMALVKKLNALEVENKQLKKVTDDLKALVLSPRRALASSRVGNQPPSLLPPSLLPPSLLLPSLLLLTRKTMTSTSLEAPMRRKARRRSGSRRRG